MGNVRSYKDLLVWQKGINLVKMDYDVTSLIPDDERFGLTSQIRRSSISVPSNIAEGYGRAITAYFIQFLNISRGSLFELETQLTIANRLGFMKEVDYSTITNKIAEIQNMTFRLKKALKKIKTTNVLST